MFYMHENGKRDFLTSNNASSCFSISYLNWLTLENAKAEMYKETWLSTREH